MNQHSNPLDYLIGCCEQTLIQGKWKLDKFTINNAKDELKKLRQSNKDLAQDCFNANLFATEDTERWLACEKDRCLLDEKYRNLLKVFDNPVAWGKVNDKGDLYDLRTQYNHFTPEASVVPLYSNKVEFKDFYKNHKNKND